LLRARRPEETQRLALFGISFGAAVAVAAAMQRTDIDAIVLDSPVPDFAQAAMIQMNGLGAPSGLLRRLAVKLAQQMTRAQYADVRMLDLISSLRCPAFIIAPDHDVLLDDGIGARLRESLPTNSVYWLVPDTGHLLALPTDPEEYQRRIAEFLDARLSSVGEMSRISG
jgi:pimeloyl-ACP methyl ester carboxylesterase